MTDRAGPAGKTVYILGAGFSRPAGAPNQAEILGEIFRLGEEHGEIASAKQGLREFLEKDLCIDNLEQAPLEDIYTPIDRCIADGTSMRSRSPRELAEVRAKLEYLISHAISHRIAGYAADHPGATEYIGDFAAHIVEKAAGRAQAVSGSRSADPARDYDPISIVSLNWDTLLDDALHAALFRQCDLTGDYDPFGVVDYCCYASSLKENDPRVRAGLFSLGCRGYNVKLLKLHGSMNWLQCPNCQRLFVDFNRKEELLNMLGRETCRHCRKHGHTNYLQGSLVMPTFLKDLSNFQVKLVWQNAGVELMEAKRLVFIGYSLPYADFEFRQLLSRMTHAGTSIDVVLYEGASEESKRRYEGEVERYRQFFGRRAMTFEPAGVGEFVKKLTRGKSFVARG